MKMNMSNVVVLVSTVAACLLMVRAGTLPSTIIYAGTGEATCNTVSCDQGYFQLTNKGTEVFNVAVKSFAPAADTTDPTVTWDANCVIPTSSDGTDTYALQPNQAVKCATQCVGGSTTSDAEYTGTLTLIGSDGTTYDEDYKSKYEGTCSDTDTVLISSVSPVCDLTDVSCLTGSFSLTNVDTVADTTVMMDGVSQAGVGLTAVVAGCLVPTTGAGYTLPKSGGTVSCDLTCTANSASAAGMGTASVDFAAVSGTTKETTDILNYVIAACPVEIASTTSTTTTTTTTTVAGDSGGSGDTTAAGDSGGSGDTQSASDYSSTSDAQTVVSKVLPVACAFGVAANLLI